MKEPTPEEMQIAVSEAVSEAATLGNELMDVLNPLFNTEKLSTVSLSLMIILVAMRRTMMPDTTLEEMIQVMRSLDDSSPQMKWVHTSHMSDSEH